MMEILDKINKLKEWNVNCEVGYTYKLESLLFKGDEYRPGMVHMVVIKDDVQVMWNKVVYIVKGDPKSAMKVIDKLKVVEHLDNEEVVKMVDIAYSKLAENDAETKEECVDYRSNLWKARYLPEVVKASGRMFDKEEARRFGVGLWDEGRLDTKKLEVSYKDKVFTVKDIPKSIGIIVEMIYRLECKKCKDTENVSIGSPYGE